VIVLIDSAATAGGIATADLTGWASAQRVFISSVMAEFTNPTSRDRRGDHLARGGARLVRRLRLEGRRRAGRLPRGGRKLEHLPGCPRAHLWLASALATARHASGVPDAEARGLRVSVWVHNNEEFQEDQGAFVEEVRQFHTTGAYTTPEHLAADVTNRLIRIAAGDLSPWRKLGDVLAALESLPPGKWSANRDIQFTYAECSHDVRVTAITTKTTSSRGTGLEITVGREPDYGNGPMSFSFSLNNATCTADDITEIKLRRALFGEAKPQGTLSLGADIGDPLSQLPAATRPVELHRDVLGLLITEAFVGSGPPPASPGCRSPHMNP
jgi:hypothetical protein